MLTSVMVSVCKEGLLITPLLNFGMSEPGSKKTIHATECLRSNGLWASTCCPNRPESLGLCSPEKTSPSVLLEMKTEPSSERNLSHQPQAADHHCPGPSLRGTGPPPQPRETQACGQRRKQRLGTQTDLPKEVKSEGQQYI